jgi:AcrR family transcriptional regulator
MASMEPAATSQALSGERAQRIVESMRRSVARRGSAGSTFDHVAREAGVSRGLLHYYFKTKEQLLAEVVRRECDVRLARLEEQLAGAGSADDFVDVLVVGLHDMVRRDPDLVTLVFELFTLSRRNPEIAAEFADLQRRSREHVAAVLAAKQSEGVLTLRAEPEAVADVLFSLGDGLALRMLAEPDVDFGPSVDAAVVAVHTLLTAGG